MNKNLTEIIYILDRSGSMSGLEKDTIGGYNGFLEKQKNEDGGAVVTTVLFDDKYEIVHDRVDIKKIKPLTSKEYYARGMTALLDAIGKTIIRVSERQKNSLESELPKKTICIITTDGFENSSREFDLRKIKALIERQKEKYGWEFLFLGANIDAVATANQFGITKERAVTYKADNEGTALNFRCVSEAVSNVRCGRPMEPTWSEEIKAHSVGCDRTQVKNKRKK